MPSPPAATRPFRVAVTLLFVAFAALYIGLVIRGIVGALARDGDLQVAAGPADCRRPPDSCARDLGGLRQALEGQAAALQHAGTRAERLWDDWVIGWRRDLATLRAACCLRGPSPAPERVSLSRGAADLEQLGRLYTTWMVQYAREIGPTAERCQTELAVTGSALPSPAEAPEPPSFPAHR